MRRLKESSDATTKEISLETPMSFHHENWLHWLIPRIHAQTFLCASARTDILSRRNVKVFEYVSYRSNLKIWIFLNE